MARVEFNRHGRKYNKQEQVRMIEQKLVRIYDEMDRLIEQMEKTSSLAEFEKLYGRFLQLRVKMYGMEEEIKKLKSNNQNI